MNLKDALALYYGNIEVVKACLGDLQIWPEEGPPPSGLSFIGAFGATTGSSSSTGTRSGLGHAYTDILPAGNWYIEVETSALTELDNAVGIWNESTPNDAGDHIHVGNWYGEIAGGLLIGGPWWTYTILDTVYVDGMAPDNTTVPIYRVGLTINTSTGEMQVGQVTSSTRTLLPVGTLSAVDSLRLTVSLLEGNSASIVAPGSHFHAPPSGCTALG